MGFRSTLGVLVARVAARVIRLTGLGRATNLPGKLALAIAPEILTDLMQGLPQGAVIVSATNGKTTTAAMISRILEDEFLVARNEGGANLVAGVVTALAIAPKDSQIGVLEVDEAALPLVAAAARPRLLVLSNLFRDQLDRHGELQMLARKWRMMLDEIDEMELVLSGDDPLVASLGERFSGKTTFFGFDDSTFGAEALSDAADSTFCEGCGKRLTYESIYMAHLGHWHCDECGRARPQLNVWADQIELVGLAGARCRISFRQNPHRSEVRGKDVSVVTADLTLRLPGLYNLANALAAISACLQLGIDLMTATSRLNDFSAAFGRFEEIQVGSAVGYMILMKNPAGANQVLRTIAHDLEGSPLVLVLNDAIADGQDVSWIWDVDFESIVSKASVVICSGTRADEMAVRLDYADVPADRIQIIRDPVAATRLAAQEAVDRPFFLLPTYTAMFELSKSLSSTRASR